MFLSHVPRITQPKNSVPMSESVSIARFHTDTHESKYRGHPFRISGIFPSTYHRGSVQYEHKPWFQAGLPVASTPPRWYIYGSCILVSHPNVMIQELQCSEGHSTWKDISFCEVWMFFNTVKCRYSNVGSKNPPWLSSIKFLL